jgi:hypothetical protein
MLPGARDTGLLRLQLSVGTDADGRPMGAVRAPDGPDVPFVGWLSLMTVITHFLPEPDEGDHRPDS